ncbi:MAG: alpha-amylase family glycosyl hydrolase [Candidatus Kapaibacterium sp.]
MKHRAELIAIVCAVVLLPSVLRAQVVTSDPSPVRMDQPVTISFHADRGSRGLAGFTGDVYAHTGVITTRSTGPADWRYVKTQWGQNTPETKLTRVSANLYTLTITDIRSYYGVPQSEDVLRLAMVFRSADNGREGKGDGNSDLFLEVIQPGMSVRIITPPSSPVLLSLNAVQPVFAVATSLGRTVEKLDLFLDDSLLTSVADDTLRHDVSVSRLGTHFVRCIGADDQGATDTAVVELDVVGPTIDEPRPAGIREGVTIVDDSTVIFCLYAPLKQSVFVIGDFNDYAVRNEDMMKRDRTDSLNTYFWLRKSGFKSGTEVGYQYLVDGAIRVGDPFAHGALSEALESGILADNRYPNLKRYPRGKTKEFVTTFVMRARNDDPEYAYDWKTPPFTRPAAKDLVIYELLVRDFTERRTYQAVIDSLDYLASLGINAIELMPVSQADGNQTWGYDPVFHMAMNRYYGTEQDLKRLVDACHARGIAVLLDVVYNHATGASPLVRLWASGTYGPATAQNPYANTSPKHPFNVFNDLNHESAALQRYVDRANEYWLKEFRIDGYRYDLSKGLTQKQTLGTGGNEADKMAAYDSSRVRILTRMASAVRTYDTTAVLILEHFADAREERELAERGFLLWHNMNGTYIDASMGWINGLLDNGTAQVYYKNRGLTRPANVAYMESHDEERLMKKHYCYGNTTVPGYSTRDTSVALKRAAAAAAMFLPVPGPRMIWQFGERGYDVGLQLQTANGACTDNPSIRLSVKPSYWNYRSEPRRAELIKTYAALNRLRAYPTFGSLETELTMKANRNDTVRWIQFRHPDMNAVIVANYGLRQRAVSIPFPSSGTYYDYFTGDSITVTGGSVTSQFAAGEFHVLTTKNLPNPDRIGVPLGVEDEREMFALSLMPNPSEGQCTVQVPAALVAPDAVIDIVSPEGRRIASAPAAEERVTFTDLPRGMVVVTVRAGGRIRALQKMIVVGP